jgi:transposase
MSGVEDWAEIRRLHRGEGLPIKVIARVLGVSRNTVRAAIASDAPPKYERKAARPAIQTSLP